MGDRSGPEPGGPRGWARTLSSQPPGSTTSPWEAARPLPALRNWRPSPCGCIPQDVRASFPKCSVPRPPSGLRSWHLLVMDFSVVTRPASAHQRSPRGRHTVVTFHWPRRSEETCIHMQTPHGRQQVHVAFGAPTGTPAEIPLLAPPRLSSLGKVAIPPRRHPPTPLRRRRCLHTALSVTFNETHARLRDPCRSGAARGARRSHRVL